MPPIYIFDIGSKDPENNQINYEWVKNLSTVNGMYDKDSFGGYPSYFFVRP